MTFPVQKHVPIPRKARSVTRFKYPFREMEIGDMFFVPEMTENTLVQYVSAAGKELGRRFTTRLTYMVLKRKQWVPADANTPGAVQGIGVWRVE